YDWERPRHRVFVDAFEMAAAPVLRRDYAQFLIETAGAQPRGGSEPDFAQPEQPVVGVSWFDAVAYCEWLSRSTGRSHRLPTEAEWEKACKGGGDFEYAWGDEPPDSFEYFRGEWRAPRPVGAWPANAFGLFDIGHNVHEWCQDWYAPDYYAVSPERNP